MKTTIRSFLPMLLLAAGACGADTPERGDVAAATDTQPAPISEVQSVGVRNATMPVAGLVAAGQLTEEQMDALGEMGYRTFVSLRPEAEEGAGWEEVHVAEHDESFSRVPVAGADGLTRENVERLHSLLEEAGEEGAVLYCSSSNRVGALLALRAHWIEGASPEEALALGRRAGLRGLEGPVTELLAEGR